MSEVATVFAPEPELDEVRYAALLTVKDETGEYDKKSCRNELYLFSKGTELDSAYDQAAAIQQMNDQCVEAFLCEVFVKDQLVRG